MALSKLLRVMRGAVGCLWLATVEKARPGVLPGVPPLPPTLPCSSCLLADESTPAGQRFHGASTALVQVRVTFHNIMDQEDFYSCA
jgi:hypothetical protein